MISINIWAGIGLLCGWCGFVAITTRAQDRRYKRQMDRLNQVQTTIANLNDSLKLLENLIRQARQTPLTIVTLAGKPATLTGVTIVAEFTQTGFLSFSVTVECSIGHAKTVRGMSGTQFQSFQPALLDAVQDAARAVNSKKRKRN